MIFSSNYAEYGNLWPDELKVLIVDNERDMLNLIRLSLEPAGFRVIRTTKPEEGLQLALTEKPDLLLFDVVIANMSGFELLRRIRRNSDMNGIPAIVVSAQANNPDQLRMLRITQHDEEEVDAYLGKPFDPAKLLRTVKDVLIRHKDYLIEKNRPLEKPWDANRAAYH